MVKQDCRRRMWIAVVLGLLFAAVLPIAALMNLQRYEAQAGIVYEMWIRDSSYYNLLDDWIDEKKVGALAVARKLRPRFLEVCRKYPRQNRAVRSLSLIHISCPGRLLRSPACW